MRYSRTHRSATAVTVVSVPLLVLQLLFSATFSHCDCYACYHLLRVDVIFTDGARMNGYIPYFGSYVGSVPVSVGNDVKPNLMNAYAEEDSLRFYRKIHFLEGFTFGARYDDVEMLPFSDIKAVNVLEKTDHGQATEVNLFSDKAIELPTRGLYHTLSLEDREAPLVWVYANCNPDISGDQFSAIVTLIHTRCRTRYDLLAGGHIRTLRSARHERDPDAIGRVIGNLNVSIEYLKNVVDSIGQWSDDSVVVKYASRHVKNLAGQLTDLRDLAQALQLLVSGDSTPALAYDFLSQRLEMMLGPGPHLEDMDVTRFVPGETAWETFHAIIDMVGPELERNRNELAEDMDMVVARIYWD